MPTGTRSMNRQSPRPAAPRLSGTIGALENFPKQEQFASRPSSWLNFSIDPVCSVTDSDFGDLHTVMYRTPGSVLFSELHARVDPNGSMRRVSQTWYRENVLLEEKQGGTGQSAGAGWEQLDSQLRGPYAVYNSQWDACMAGLQDFTGLWNLAGMLKSHGINAGHFGTHFSKALCTSLLLLLPSANNTHCTLDILNPVPGDALWLFERISWIDDKGVMSMLTFAEMVHWAKQFPGREVTQQLYASYDAMWHRWLCCAKDLDLEMDLHLGVDYAAQDVGFFADM